MNIEVLLRKQTSSPDHSFILSYLWIFLSGLFFLSPRAWAQNAGEEIILKLRAPAGFGKSLAEQEAFLNSLAGRLGAFDSRRLPLSRGLRDSEFGRIWVLRLPSGNIPPEMLDSLESLPEVDYACRNHVFRVEQLSPDPREDEQWGLKAAHFSGAWKLSRGSPQVPIVLIDTGIDTAHEDLSGQIWINPGEDVNHNGRADPADLNGIDDDGNGFVDDVAGWDFVDAPRYPDSGDYRDPDPDPADEHGHGTAIAGILVARAGNGLGISGAAPESRVVNLRAGTSQGVLEEDDVGAAILYAVDMGFRIISMSFGDVAITPFLRDVIRYAHGRGVIMLASSGNSGDDVMHYPSGLSETVSVGASSESGYRASFSSYGSSLDLLAPGLRILTTRRGGGYEEVSGTSAAAPFVSAAVALMLSLRPDLPVEVVRDRLLGTAEDVAPQGWDFESGAGLLRADRAVQDVGPTKVRILWPEQDQGISGGGVPVVATCAGALVRGFELSVGVGENPGNWEVLATDETRQVIAETLFTWRAPEGADTSYTFRLRAFLRGNGDVEDFVTVRVDRSPPRVLSFENFAVRQGEAVGHLIRMDTDDVVRLVRYSRPAGSSGGFAERHFPLENRHPVDILFARPGERLEVYWTLENATGLQTAVPESGLLQISAEAGFPANLALEVLQAQLPRGYVLPAAYDFTGDGLPELVMNRLGPSGQFGHLAYLRYREGKLKLEVEVPLTVIPRDVADANGDGVADLLVGAGRASAILTPGGGSPYPNTVVWMDTNDVWAGRLYDFNGDGLPELLARIGNRWKIWLNTGNFSFSPQTDLENPTEASNGTGVPHAEIADFNGDGKPEVLVGDYDGDLYLYSVGADLQAEVIWQERMPMPDAIDFLASGDFDGDGKPEFAAACHPTGNLDLEHQLDDRTWLARIYDFAGGKFQIRYEEQFLGYTDPRQFFSGMGAGDLDGDGDDELLLSFYPHLYVVDWDGGEARYRVVAHTRPADNSRLCVADFDGDGVPELFSNRGTDAALFELRGYPGGRP
ncbi:MAG TPA: hypothetical protein ENJ23_02695, partial [Bacteroidetes bacterium]|nr:hypothetical protein [Bacteroidota bacterium]